MVKTSLDAGAINSNNVHSICSICSLPIFRGVVVRFRTPETHTNEQQRQSTLQTMSIEVREGQAAAARQMAQGAAASSPITAVLCVCVRGGKVAYPRDDIWGRNTFPVYFPILEIVTTNIRLHMQRTQILLQANLAEIKIYYLHRGIINNGLI